MTPDFSLYHHNSIHTRVSTARRNYIARLFLTSLIRRGATSSGVLRSSRRQSASTNVSPLPAVLAHFSRSRQTEQRGCSTVAIITLAVRKNSVRLQPCTLRLHTCVALVACRRPSSQPQTKQRFPSAAAASTSTFVRSDYLKHPKGAESALPLTRRRGLWRLVAVSAKSSAADAATVCWLQVQGGREDQMLVAGSSETCAGCSPPAYICGRWAPERQVIERRHGFSRNAPVKSDQVYPCDV